MICQWKYNTYKYKNQTKTDSLSKQICYIWIYILTRTNIAMCTSKLK